MAAAMPYSRYIIANGPANLLPQVSLSRVTNWSIGGGLAVSLLADGRRGGMRMLFAWIFVLGVLGSVVTHLPSRRSPPATELFVNAAGAAEETNTSESSKPVPPNDGALEIQRSDNGHFYADVDVNGTKVNMLIDTGATGIALSREDARSAGIATSIGMNDVVGEGADGSVHGEVVTVDRMS